MPNVHLEVGQERMAFLSPFISNEQKASRKGARKVVILGLPGRKGQLPVRIKATGETAYISKLGILPYPKEVEFKTSLDLLKHKLENNKAR